jgi:prepilin-type N-terminal cleavage/methylation domain-containing protein
MKTRAHRGMTVLELMIVLAIIGGAVVLVRSGFRLLTKADLVENATELSALMKRTGQLAIEHGEMHRLVIDMETQLYSVEKCEGATAIVRNEAVKDDPEAKKRALERGKDRMLGLPPDALAAGDPDEATRRATALSGHHIADKTCSPASDAVSGAAKGKVDLASGKSVGGDAGWTRKLSVGKGIKFKEIWVQHRDESVTKGQVAIYFFPAGSSEKAVVEITDGSEVFSVLVNGLTGAVELKDGVLRDVNDHMLRNVMGDKDAKRESSQ